MTQIQVLNSHQLETAATHLKKGEVMGIPTETVYGLAGLLSETNALLKIFEAKERPLFDPLIAHVALTLDQLKNPLLALEIQGLISLNKLSPQAQNLATQLIQKFWPGPLTLVLPRGPRVPDLATSGLDTLAIRMPSHPLTLELIQKVGQALAAPSANRFGRISPTSAQDVVSELGDRIEYVLDGGRCEVGVESTIVHLSQTGELTLLRPGGLAPETLETSVGVPLHRPTQGPKELGPQLAPGMLPSHYAPQKPLILVDSAQKLPSTLEKLPLPLKLGVISFTSAFAQSAKSWSPAFHIRLDALDLAASARDLFSSLRALDQNPAVQTLICESLQAPKGLGFAIQDRLTRAAGKRHAP